LGGEEARALVARILGRLTEGLELRELRAARAVLAS
jgi:hypothetical protein